MSFAAAAASTPRASTRGNQSNTANANTSTPAPVRGSAIVEGTRYPLVRSEFNADPLAFSRAKLRELYDRDYRNFQAQAIVALLAGKVVFLSVATGRGKSVCFDAIPAFHTNSKKCVIFIIVPTDALGEDIVSCFDFSIALFIRCEGQGEAEISLASCSSHWQESEHWVEEPNSTRPVQLRHNGMLRFQISFMPA
jgi:hypothetical protein